LTDNLSRLWSCNNDSSRQRRRRPTTLLLLASSEAGSEMGELAKMMTVPFIWRMSKKVQELSNNLFMSQCCHHTS
jgi:hypothetical protein